MASGLMACRLALLAVHSTAQAGVILNAEPNDTFSTAQVIPSTAFTQEFNPFIGTGGGGGFMNTSTTIPHVTILRPGAGQTTANFDFFRFTTFQSGIIVADIDNTPTPTNFDMVLHLFDSKGKLLATNDNEVATGPGNGPGLIGGLLDSRIETGILPPGDYVVAVAKSPSFGSEGGGVTDPIPAGGSYTLNISAQAVPEPSTLALLGVGVGGLLGCCAWRRRKRA
jgi:hypothetical protein